MGTGVQCVLQRMHNMTAESASGALHSEREMCYSRTIMVLYDSLITKKMVFYGSLMILLLLLLESLFHQGYPTDGRLLTGNPSSSRSCWLNNVEEDIQRSEAGKEFHLSAARNESE